MIIDFRIRPPLGGFLNSSMYLNLERTASLTRGLGMEQPPSAANRSIDLLLKEMNEAGVSRGVIQGRIPNKVFGSAGTDDLLAMVREYPDHFYGYCGVDPADARGACEEVEKHVLNGPFKGVVIEPGILEDALRGDDPGIYPLYSYCAEQGVPVVLMTGGNGGPDVSFSSPEQADRIARDFPELKLIISHGGWPWVTHILYVALRRPNVYVSPDMYLCNCPGWQDYLTAANGFLQDRFLFATAYPFLPLKQAVEQFSRLPFKPEVLPKLLYENAQTLLNML